VHRPTNRNFYSAPTSVRELEFANYATKFAVSAANQYKVGRCDVTLDCAHDQLTLDVTADKFRSVQFSSFRAMQTNLLINTFTIA